ncbi:MAG: carboxylesterase/lipase family protein [Woeseiaceae bacterium]
MELATRLGRVRGLDDGHVRTFLGLRYGEPPVGELRFMPPVAASGWQGTFDATEFPNRAMQDDSRRMFERTIAGEPSEDCLFLNIYTPDTSGKPRPVLFWMHGGAFVGGSANEYDGSVLAAQGDVVVVTVNFRLGLLGFLGLSAFGSEYQGSESNGIRDVVLALQWVRDNIEDYGGDPDNVTISGESSGGTMVMSLLATPAADDLYNKAIGHSATCVYRPSRDHSEQLAERIGVDRDDLLDRLLSMPAQHLADLNLPVGVGVDGTVITRSTMDAIQDRGHSGVPLLTGTNLREGALYTLGEDAEQEHYASFNKGLAQEGLLGKDPTNFMAAVTEAFPDASAGKMHEMMWNHMFRCICLHAAEAASEAGPGGWLYRFDLPANLPDKNKLGACHASELAFTFNIFEKPETYTLIFHDRNDPVVRRVAKDWSDTIIRFVRSGDPNGGDIPDWPHYGPKDRRCLIIDEEIRVESDPDEQLREFWKR